MVTLVGAGVSACVNLYRLHDSNSPHYGMISHAISLWPPGPTRDT